jgi:drug/metabolite transporter (DMT)-like permease
MIFGGGALFISAIAAGQFNELSAPPPVAIFGLVFSTIGSSSLANVLYFTAVPIVGVSRVASFQLLVPFLAVVVSAAVLSEALEPIQAFGGALILLGIWAGRQTSSPFRRRLR